MTIKEAIDFREKDYHISLSSFESHEECREYIKKCATYDRIAYRSLVIWNETRETLEGQIKEAINFHETELADSLTEVLEYINDRIHDIEELSV